MHIFANPIKYVGYVLINVIVVLVNSKPTKQKILDHVVPYVTPRWYELGVKCKIAKFQYNVANQANTVNISVLCTLDITIKHSYLAS